jgi:hypothetical protein
MFKNQFEPLVERPQRIKWVGPKKDRAPDERGQAKRIAKIERAKQRRSIEEQLLDEMLEDI